MMCFNVLVPGCSHGRPSVEGPSCRLTGEVLEKEKEKQLF